MSTPSWQWPSLDVLVSGPAHLDVTGWQPFWESAPFPAFRELQVTTGPLPSPPPQLQPRSWPLMNQMVPVLRWGNELWLDNDVYVQVDARRSHLICRQATVPAELISLAFTEVHRAGGWLPLHAAVVARNGRAVAISGASGAGKSTALLRLLAAGFELVAEDRVFWHAQTGLVVGLDRCLRVYRDSLECFAPAWLDRLASLPQDVKGKWMLPLPAGTTAHLKRVLLLGAPAQQNLAAVVRAAWEMTGVPLSAAAQQQVQHGIGQLLPLIQPQGVSRDEVIEQVKEILETSG